MTHTEIEAFLAICRNKTVTAAAQSLHIEQSSLSARLKTLEADLGGLLFQRRRGSREMALTPAGQTFYSLALQYEELVDRMGRVCRTQPRSLCISSFNSVGTYLLPGACDRFLQQYPEVDLELADMGLELSIPRLLSREVDLAFTVSTVARRGLLFTPLFSEPLFLVSASSFLEPVPLDALSVRNEAYISWGIKYDEWHLQTFGTAQRPRYRLSMTEQLSQLLLEPGCWAIVPRTVLAALEKEPGIRCHTTAFALPRRTISCVTVKDPVNRDLIHAFVDCLRQTLTVWPEIELL